MIREVRSQRKMTKGLGSSYIYWGLVTTTLTVANNDNCIQGGGKGVEGEETVPLEEYFWTVES